MVGNRMFAENLVGLGLLSYVSYIKPILTQEKIFCGGEKVAQMSVSTYNFSCVGFALDWGVRRFQNNVYTFPNPTESGTGISQLP